MRPIDATHDPALRSWIASANAPDADFPLQNLPFAIFRPAGGGEPRGGVGIGDRILDVAACADGFDGAARDAALLCRAPTLNALMARGPAAASALRHALSRLLRDDGTPPPEAAVRALHPIDAVALQLPARIGGYTDFFASIHHATHAGRLFRPDAPLLPNYKYVPVAYNGRANSVRASGAALRRPWGQARPAGREAPVFAPSQRMDYEVELGAWVGAPSGGTPLDPGRAWEHVFGVSLLNDWSARDIQAWEYQPLGPFLGKSFATTVGPWIVTAEALAPFHVPAARRDDGDPAVLPHLRDDADLRHGNLDIRLDAWLRTAHMRARHLPAQRLSHASSRDLYWTFAQMLAHHTSNDSALDPGDLLGSGTVSEARDDALGSLLEITRGGQQALRIDATGESRTFLEDGDEIRLAARCTRDGFVSIGFGPCIGTLDAARPAGTAGRAAP